MNTTKSANRIDWVDCSKGIAILLVIFGHTLSYNGVLEKMLRGGIFSFHMPLFFIVSGVTYKLSIDNKQFLHKMRKAFVHLVIPALGIYALRTLINIVNNFQTIEWKDYLREKVIVLFYASGVETSLNNMTIPAFGMMWFLVVLFCGRTLYDWLHLKLSKVQFIVVICTLTVVGVALGNLHWLPLSLDIMFAIMIFFLIGNVIKEIDFDKKNIWGCWASFAVWAILISISYFVGNDYLELAGRRYPFFPLCYVIAVAGTAFVAYFSQSLLKLSALSRPLIYLGKNSIFLYCVHAMDYVYEFVWDRTESSIINGMIRVFMDVVVCLLVIKAVERVKRKE